MRARILIGLAAVIVGVAAWMFWPKKADLGGPRFFADQTYNFQTIRAVASIASLASPVFGTRRCSIGFRRSSARRVHGA